MATLITELEQLENAQLVRRLAEEELAYLFKHALTQETAYNSLLVKRRRKIHRLVAETIEQLYHDQLDENASRLAQHYAEAGDDAKTVEYATRAGESALRLFAHPEAVAHFALALEAAKRLLASPPSVVVQELYLKLGRALELSGRYGEALANYEAMEARAREQGNGPMEVRALMAMATIRSIPTVVVDINKARQLSEQALELARELGDEPAQAKILWNLQLLSSRVELRTGEALAYGEQSLAIARRLGLREQLAYTLSDLGELYFFVGQPEHGEHVLAEAAALWRELNNLPMLTDNMSSSAVAHLAIGQFERAIQDAEGARELSRKIGNLWGEVFSGTWVGPAYFALGRPAEAIAVMQDAVRLAPEAGFQAPLAITQADLGRVYADLGDLATGEALVEAALAASSRPYGADRQLAIAMAAHVHILQGKLDRADAELTETRVQPAGDDSTVWLRAATDLTEAELDLSEGEYGRGLARLDRLIVKLRAQQLHEWLPNALYLKGKALAGQHMWDDTRRALTEARAEAESISARWWLWQILAALSESEAALDNRAAAQDLQAEASALVEYIAEHTPSELRQSFLNLPQVRSTIDAHA